MQFLIASPSWPPFHVSFVPRMTSPLFRIGQPFQHPLNPSNPVFSKPNGEWTQRLHIRTSTAL